jgi:hypothetical protein
MRLARGQPALERAHLQARVRPTLASGITAEVRYFGSSLEEEALLAEETPVLRGGFHAALGAYYDPMGWIGLGASGSLHRDRGSDLGRSDGALELRLPRLFGDAGGAWLGAEAARGWLPSRGVYLQTLARIDRRLRLLARANASRYQTADPAGQQSELGGALHLDAAVASWFRLGARALFRLPAAGSAGGMLGLDAAGAF